MTKDNKTRKTTRDEWIRIAEYCIANVNNYALAEKEFNCSYGQVYSWAKNTMSRASKGYMIDAVGINPWMSLLSWKNCRLRPGCLRRNLNSSRWRLTS